MYNDIDGIGCACDSNVEMSDEINKEYCVHDSDVEINDANINDDT